MGPGSAAGLGLASAQALVLATAAKLVLPTEPVSVPAWEQATAQDLVAGSDPA